VGIPGAKRRADVQDRSRVTEEPRASKPMAISAKHKTMGNIIQRETALQVGKRVFLITLSGSAFFLPE